jgi:branched-chain amino acid transport system ATP-binding protein
MTDRAAVLEANAVTKRFGGVTALREVSLRVRAGEVCGLIGPNGAGKTTLFDVVSGLTAPTAGAVSLDGVDVTRALPERRARSGVRRTFQRVQLFGRLSVEDNVLAAMEWRGGGGGLFADVVAAPTRRRREAARRDRAAAVLDACGLAGLAGRPAGSLPIGAARLTELARAIADRPRLLLLDEPTSGLSSQEAARFGEQIRRLRAEGVAVVLVEHDVGFVMAHSDRVVVLDLGAVLAEGAPDEIQTNPDVRRAYLG